MNSPASILELALSLARGAGDILMGHLGGLSETDIDYKGKIDLVTQADRDSEDYIARRLEEEQPEHTLLAEEAHVADLEGETLWVVDPLDGTTNFVHSLPLFCVSIAFCRSGRPEVGVVHAPALGETYCALKGEGATLNGRPIRVSTNGDLQSALLCTGFASMRDDTCPDNLGNFLRALYLSRGVRRLGSAALDLAYTACGRFDGFWEIGLSPWDVAAGALLVEEAGGRVTDHGGGPDYLAGRNIVATNGPMHERLVPLLDKDELFSHWDTVLRAIPVK